MSHLSKDIDPAFQGAGTKGGLEIWCIENFHLVRVPRASHGKFYSGSAYIVLDTVVGKSGSPQHSIHYWLGTDVKEDDLALASDKALELDEALGSCAVQYREVQGRETEKFLSFFRPCIIPVEGVYRSEAGILNGEKYCISLFACKGEHVVHVKEVAFGRSSLNHYDVFILDTASKIFLFSGCNSSIQERARALEVVHYIRENKHTGNCEVATIEDGKFVGDADVGEFWSFFGGYAPIPRDSPSAFQKQEIVESVKLFRIMTRWKLFEVGKELLNQELLDTDKCYLLDCHTDIFVWMGRCTSMMERKSSISATEDFLQNEGRSTRTHVTLLTEGLETARFKSHFVNWPKKEELKLYEEGRGKVAAMFKQRGYDVKELLEDDHEPFINCRGTTKVLHVNSSEASLVPVPDQSKLFSGDCYIVQYTYPGKGRDENLFYAWFGRASQMEDRVVALSHMYTIADSTRGFPTLAQVYQDNEPEQFFLIFQTLIIFKGGKSSRYRKLIAETGMPDETFDETKTALFRVQGKSPNNMQAIQVDQVSCSLNSSYCYILQTGLSVFAWIGNLSSTEDHELLDRMIEIINPTWQPVSIREGSEPDIFWQALGGKTEYPREKKVKQYVEGPHLFAVTLIEGDIKLKEIYNFTQGDLTTEDVFILDCQSELYVWIGRLSSVTSKEEAHTLGQKFLEMDILSEGLPRETPMYMVVEGQEPPFFTRYFSWDPSKANMHGNSFERKLALLKGGSPQSEGSVRNSWPACSRGSTLESSRRNSISSNGWGKSASPILNVLGTESWASENQLPYSPSTVKVKLFAGSSPQNGSSDDSSAFASSPALQPVVPPDNISLDQVEGSDASNNLLIYPYERLKVRSMDPVTGIDVTRREAYLSEEEFRGVFGITKRAFYQLPKWRQNKLKMSLHLF
ncbi:villin-1 isoform X2 [Rhodamnia argentea]|uniref:Villin-1 isoform X2 n=1 Tax=Rhodamnia argentea TaxID=178133 RepID=A0A8B8PRY4_9MYRT|nr:villin-1 isoform X2 [Rhodamnia argentea]